MNRLWRNFFKALNSPTLHSTQIKFSICKNYIIFAIHLKISIQVIFRCLITRIPFLTAALKNLLTKICESEIEETRNKHFDELHDLVTLVQFANDECDYGMGLELGMDLFCFGKDAFKSMVLSLLPMAYSLLRRDLFGDIVKKHLNYRKKERPIDLTDEKDKEMLMPQTQT